MAMFCALSSAQVALPPLGQLPPPMNQTPPVQLPPVGQLPPPVQLPPVGQLPPPTNQTPPVQTPPVQTCNPSSAVTSLAPCVGYLIGNTSAPSTGCCDLVSSLLTSQTPCLCSMLKSGLGPLGFVFNQTQAMTLPSICNMPTNPCTDASGPTAEPATPSVPTAATPVTAQTPSTAVTPPVSTVPSGTGVKAVPTTVSAGTRSATDLAPALLIVLSVASYLSNIRGF
ncbi:Bifunctional inhibitor/lipid-transfer protein/seed storage 2S albumin superfamily protein [Carex littledalei]|uniref:Bifunctional inhibitor/lipid-transfer protein/seed storage 2S albumin superfamily protein n=1 Tax=Carex littledalei TaxID=544730 RepID=A0A833VIL3_9POAL|nr:Bifunctional inhibitor/lipid-transfer protein/seed storage 2S albumin superfamily protein [Carex littledalei]